MTDSFTILATLEEALKNRDEIERSIAMHLAEKEVHRKNTDDELVIEKQLLAIANEMVMSIQKEIAIYLLKARQEENSCQHQAHFGEKFCYKCGEQISPTHLTGDVLL